MSAASALSDVLLVSGTRPEIIKLAPVYHALRESSWARVQWLHTGQHDEMARQILACFDVEPDITLTRSGKIIIKGSYIVSHSTGCNKIKGAAVDIN